MTEKEVSDAMDLTLSRLNIPIDPTKGSLEDRVKVELMLTVMDAMQSTRLKLQLLNIVNKNKKSEDTLSDEVIEVVRAISNTLQLILK